MLTPRENPAGMVDAFMAISQGAISRNPYVSVVCDILRLSFHKVQ